MALFSAQTLIRSKIVWCFILALFMVNLYIVISHVSDLHGMLDHMIKIKQAQSEERKDNINKAKVAKVVDALKMLRPITNKEKSFTCKDGSVKININAVNDDYCDCPDGSDEPKTNACNNGRFYCAVEKKYFPSWYVNDGICDCCDGSDEWLKLPPVGFIRPQKHPTKNFSPCSITCNVHDRLR